MQHRAMRIYWVVLTILDENGNPAGYFDGKFTIRSRDGRKAILPDLIKNEMARKYGFDSKRMLLNSFTQVAGAR